MQVDTDLVFMLLDPVAQEADAGMFDDDEDHEPASNVSKEYDGHPSADSLDAPALFEPRPPLTFCGTSSQNICNRAG